MATVGVKGLKPQHVSMYRGLHLRIPLRQDTIFTIILWHHPTYSPVGYHRH